MPVLPGALRAVCATLCQLPPHMQGRATAACRALRGADTLLARFVEEGTWGAMQAASHSLQGLVGAAAAGSPDAPDA